MPTFARDLHTKSFPHIKRSHMHTEPVLPSWDALEAVLDFLSTSNTFQKKCAQLLTLSDPINNFPPNKSFAKIRGKKTSCHK